MKLKKGDNVLVMRGRDKGRKGKVSKVLREEARVVVEGINIRKVHVRPRRQGEKGQILEKMLPVSAANVRLLCSACGKPARIGYVLEEKSKVRVCKRCGKPVV